MLVASGLVYLVMVILVRLLLVPVVILFVLPLVAISAFAALAVAGRHRDLSALTYPGCGPTRAIL